MPAASGTGGQKADAGGGAPGGPREGAEVGRQQQETGEGSRDGSRAPTWCPPTWEAAGAAHGSEDGRLHLDVADTRSVGCPQVPLLVLLRVAAEGPVQTTLP